VRDGRGVWRARGDNVGRAPASVATDAWSPRSDCVQPPATPASAHKPLDVVDSQSDPASLQLAATRRLIRLRVRGATHARAGGTGAGSDGTSSVRRESRACQLDTQEAPVVVEIARPAIGDLDARQPPEGTRSRRLPRPRRPRSPCAGHRSTSLRARRFENCSCRGYADPNTVTSASGLVEIHRFCFTHTRETPWPWRSCVAMRVDSEVFTISRVKLPTARLQVLKQPPRSATACSRPSTSQSSWKNARRRNSATLTVPERKPF